MGKHEGVRAEQEGVMARRRRGGLTKHGHEEGGALLNENKNHGPIVWCQGWPTAVKGQPKAVQRQLTAVERLFWALPGAKEKNRVIKGRRGGKRWQPMIGIMSASLYKG